MTVYYYTVHVWFVQKVYTVECTIIHTYSIYLSQFSYLSKINDVLYFTARYDCSYNIYTIFAVTYRASLAKFAKLK